MSVQGPERRAVVAFAPKKDRPDATVVADDAGHAILTLLQRQPIWRRKTAREPRISHTSFLSSCGLPRRKPASLDNRRLIFGTVPFVRKIGSHAFTMRSSRRSFRKTNARRVRHGRQKLKPSLTAFLN